MMKFRMKFWLLGLALALCVLTACGGAPEVPSGGGSPDILEEPSLARDEEPERVVCRIVDGAEDGELLLAGLEGFTGVYRLRVTEETAVTLDGQPADASVLEDGMPVEVCFDGSILETFPGGFGKVYSLVVWSRGQSRNPMGTAYDLCGLYLQVLDDLWQKDPALNEDISQAALDLSGAPGELTESEKEAIVWRFGESHGVEAFSATFEQLQDQGLIAAEPLDGGAPEGAAFLHWPDGCFFSISANSDHEGESYSLPVVFFNAGKWRSSLGAYEFYDCSALWPGAGSWEAYSVGSEMIS